MMVGSALTKSTTSYAACHGCRYNSHGAPDVQGVPFSNTITIAQAVGDPIMPNSLIYKLGAQHNFYFHSWYMEHAALEALYAPASSQTLAGEW
jgi:hypothetical protein